MDHHTVEIGSTSSVYTTALVMLTIGRKTEAIKLVCLAVFLAYSLRFRKKRNQLIGCRKWPLKVLNFLLTLLQRKC